VSHERTTVRVDLGSRSYDIEIGSGLLSSLGVFVASRNTVHHAVIIADANVASFASRVEQSLLAVSARTTLLSVPPGEESKSIAVAERLWNELLEAQTDRKSLVIAVGGGVIGDLAGFVAATFARGLPFFQVPTTLLAHVDSSVGGKVAVNLPAAKNMVGVFWQPSGVLIDVDTLRTLPEREYRAGLAEVVKYGVILDEHFFGTLERHWEALLNRDPATLVDVIAHCCRLKAQVVSQDERETTGLRAVLNYGHTFGHAVESVAGYGEFLHGEAVAIGMTCAARLARILGRIDEATVHRQQQLLERLALPTALPAFKHQELIAAMRHDKKVEFGKLRFVLPSRIGHVELVDGVEVHQIEQALTGTGV